MKKINGVWCKYCNLFSDEEQCDELLDQCPNCDEDAKKASGYRYKPDTY